MFKVTSNHPLVKVGPHYIVHPNISNFGIIPARIKGLPKAGEILGPGIEPQDISWLSEKGFDIPALKTALAGPKGFRFSVHGEETGQEEAYLQAAVGRLAEYLEVKVVDPALLPVIEEMRVADDQRVFLKVQRGTQDEHLALIKHIQRLGGLDLTHTQITDQGLANLTEDGQRNFPDLEILDLGGCYEITDAGLRFLVAFPKLQTLHLTALKKVTDAGLEHIKGLANLKVLRIQGTSISSERITHFFQEVNGMERGLFIE